MTENHVCPGRDAYFENIAAAAEGFKDAEALAGKTILVTGATGLLGGALVRTLSYINETRGTGIKLLCPTRNLRSAEAALSGVFHLRETNVFEADITRPFDVTGPVDYIVHTAAPTASAYFVSNPADTLRAITGGTEAVLELAREKQASGLVNVSSMEAFGAVYDAVPRTEEMLGYIGLESPRSSYSEGKRVSELMCACWHTQYKVNACSLRLAQTFGAGVTDRENRVFMHLMKAALEGETLTLATPGLSVGNYLHVTDAVTAILTLLLRGEGGKAYNACGDGCHMTIKQLAERIAAIVSPGLKVVTGTGGANVFAPDTFLIMDSARLKALGWSPRYNVDDMIRSLARDVRGQEGRPQ